VFNIEIIDDDCDIVEIIVELINANFGETNIFTSNEYCCNLGREPDLLILDYMFKNTNGVNILEYCNRRGHCPKTIMFTAWKEQCVFDEAVIKNPNLRIVQKPNTQELVIAIRHMLSVPPVATVCPCCKNLIFWLSSDDNRETLLCEGCREKYE